MVLERLIIQTCARNWNFWSFIHKRNYINCKVYHLLCYTYIPITYTAEAHLALMHRIENDNWLFDFEFPVITYNIQMGISVGTYVPHTASNISIQGDQKSQFYRSSRGQFYIIWSEWDKSLYSIIYFNSLFF